MIKKNKKTKVTIDKLASIMKDGFSRVNKKIDNTVDLIDKLAASTLKSFNRLEENTATKTDIEGLKGQIQGLGKRIDDFAENKISKIVFKELDHRVGFMEEKLKIKQ